MELASWKNIRDARPVQMYEYDKGRVWAKRIANGTDHCDSTGAVYELSTLVTSGRVRDPEHREAILSTARSETGATRILIYAVDGKYQINVSVDGKRGSPHAVKHETLFHNAPVLAAGEMDVAEGIIVSVNDHSGSYLTYGLLDADERFAEAVLVALDRAAAPVDARLSKLLVRKANRS